jgi:hypothetical protein
MFCKGLQFYWKNRWNKDDSVLIVINSTRPEIKSSFFVFNASDRRVSLKLIFRKKHSRIDELTEKHRLS